tara:strand:+ start:132 stop:359 length:228 start_codon:yes stop_codon:yes gene_type:complete
MNERIEEFAELTGAVRYDFDTLDGTNLEELNKFAQLIVRECIEHLESSVAVPNMEHSRVKWKCIRAIKEHFGVEL